MAQQVFPLWFPLGKALDENGNEIYIPFAGVYMQTRNGKHEVITGAGAMVWDPNAGDGGMWVPASAANPLEVRVRQLEAQIEELQDRLNDVLTLLNRDMRGPAANRPAANSVPVGTVYWSVNTGDVSVSTGTTWRSLGVA